MMTTKLEQISWFWILSTLIFVTFSGLENGVTKMRNVTKLSESYQKWEMGFWRHFSIFQGVKIKTSKNKYIFIWHDEDNDKSSREKIILYFSDKFNRSISAQALKMVK